MRKQVVTGVMIFTLFFGANNSIAEEAVYKIVIKDHKFNPETLTIPAGKKVKISVENQDPTPEEFESHELNREKVIPGNKKAVIFVGPLNPGTYSYFGEFHPETAQGKIVVQ
jgi:plastocyanin